MKIIAASFLSFALIGNAWAGQVAPLTSFVPATPALASEVNKNFIQIKTAVDDNYSRVMVNTPVINTNKAAITNNVAATSANTHSININTTAITNNVAATSANTQAINNIQNSAVQIVDTAGISVARFLQLDSYSNSKLLGISTSGYIVNEQFSFFYLWTVDTYSEFIIYSDINCTAPAYFLATGLGKFGLRQGVVFLKDLNSNVSPHYIVKNTTAITPTVTTNLFKYKYSWANTGMVASCVSLATSLQNPGNPNVVSPTPSMFPLLPNDPIITGVPNNLIFPLGLL